MEPLSLQTGPAPVAGADRAAWERAAAAVLRKAGRLAESDSDDLVWTALTRHTLDGIAVPPLGTPDLAAGLVTSGRPTRPGDWDNRPLVTDPDASSAREAILTDLDSGATSVWLALGTQGVAVEAMSTALDGVLLDIAPVLLDAPEDPLGAARAFADLARTTLDDGAGVAAGTNLGVDPMGAAVRAGAEPSGSFGETVAETLAAAAGIATELSCLAVVVDGTAVGDLGASEAQELGYAMALGAAYLRGLVAAGHDVASAAGLVEFRLAVTDEQFPSIAKLRAARRLWARMLELSGVSDPVPMRIHAVTSRPMMSRYDPWVNMLRTCVAAFAAGVGGADAVTVLPFDTPLGLPDAFSRRIARNTSSLLLAESHVGAVADPAGGSHLVEKLTDDLAVAGWAELGRIEADGGVLPGLAGLRTRIEAVVAERDRQVATRKRPLTGLSEFPNLHETLPTRAPHPAGTTPVRSYGHAFEELRDRPMRQRVFLATMGAVAAHTARAIFTSNLFAAGGIDVVNAGAHEDVAAVLADHSGEPVVCLVGPDPAYAAWGAELADALREAGARWVILAGRPVEGVTVDDTCAIGLDALAFLARTREKLEETA